MDRNGIGIERRKAGERGVTLVELLIAIAVFSILMLSIVAMFVSSLRAAKAGQQSIDAYEESRGAFDVVQRDLATAFTSRDYADYYSFFGMPYGFMFVGLARGQRPTDSQVNLARVTYVLRRMPNQPQFETTIYDSSTGNTIDVIVETCSLLRFVEVGVADLNTFNLGAGSGGAATSWDELETNLEWPALTSILRRVRLQYEPNPFEANPTLPAEDILPAVEANALQEKMLSAAKCELWLRMLAGPEVCDLYQDMWLLADQRDLSVQPGSLFSSNDDPGRGYDDPVQPENPVTGYVRLPDLWERLDLDPEDYVIADNILFCAYRADDRRQIIETGFSIASGPTPLGSSVSRYYFEYGRQGTATLEQVSIPTFMRPFWNAETNATTLMLGSAPVLIDPIDGKDVLGSPLAPRIPEIVRMRLTFLLESPYPGAPDFRRQMEQVIDVPAGYVRKRN